MGTDENQSSIRSIRRRGRELCEVFNSLCLKSMATTYIETILHTIESRKKNAILFWTKYKIVHNLYLHICAYNRKQYSLMDRHFLCISLPLFCVLSFSLTSSLTLTLTLTLFLSFCLSLVIHLILALLQYRVYAYAEEKRDDYIFRTYTHIAHRIRIPKHLCVFACLFSTLTKHIFIVLFIFLKCWQLWYWTHGNAIYLWS